MTKKSDELLQLNQTTEFAPGLEGKLMQYWLMCRGGLGVQVRQLLDKGAAKAACVGRSPVWKSPSRFGATGPEQVEISHA